MAEDECEDVFKHTPIRYLGYANELGEAFRALVPIGVVRFSYVVASSYVVADSSHKGFHASKKDWPSDKVCRTKIVQAVGDTLAWQGFASVIIPGFTINRICALSTFILRKSPLPVAISKWMSTAIGLIAIPFIIHPIDRSVDYVMNNTLRTLYEPKLEESKKLIHHNRND